MTRANQQSHTHDRGFHMQGPIRILTVTVTAAAALAAILARNIVQLTPAESILAAALALLAAATTVHAIVRPARRPPLDEAYMRSYLRTSSRLTRSR